MTDADLADAVETRRNYGRLQSLVIAAAEAAEEVMDACEDAIDRAAEDLAAEDDDGGNGSNGSSSGPAGGGQPGGPGSPGALTRGHGGPPAYLTTPAAPIPTPIQPFV
jgi:hypothetical protein